MKSEASAIYGFGFLIENTQVKRLLKKYENEYDIDNLFRLIMKLPKGFSYSSTNEPLIVLISPSEDNYESKLMRGEISPKDFTPVLEWAKNNDVKFSNSIPQLHVVTYNYPSE